MYVSTVSVDFFCIESPLLQKLYDTTVLKESSNLLGNAALAQTPLHFATSIMHFYE